MARRLISAAVAGTGVVAALAVGTWLLVDRQHDTPGRQASPPAAKPVSPPWTAAALGDLTDAIEQADGEGLRSADYQIEALRQAVLSNRAGGEVDALADGAALSLAQDFAAGHVRHRHRFNWYVDYAGPTPSALAKMIVTARSQGKLGSWLDGLLPTSPDYRALREALAATPDDQAERRDRIRANMERWRWLPREFGQGDQLYVNLPAYRLDVIEGGNTVASYRAVIGATDMPTPVLSSTVAHVVANPDWIVPDSIVRKSHLRPGASSRYIFTIRPDGTMRVRQKPGPGNALGRVKITFPNALAIYFHDTPSRSLFGASTRTFSHGCVRVQGIDALAASLVASPDRFRTALAGTQTRWFAPAKAWRADIVYLTLVRGEDDSLRDLGDPYHLDEPLAAALDHRKPRPQTAPPAVVRPPTVDREIAEPPRVNEPKPAALDAAQINATAPEPGNATIER